uniref:Zgc:153184 n=1 Tax=Gasterosteus aculeatus aculeatus TaxID=481459 RepID=G3PE16_GASAC
MEDSPSKRSVAELAGRFKGHSLPMPTPNDEKAIVSPNPFKIKMKNSAMIEKIQADLALSPTALLPSRTKSPEAKLQPAPLSPTTRCCPQSPLSPTQRPSHPSSEEEDAVSFDVPPEGAALPSINKTRARLSFKRRPPTRQHRKSAGEEVDGSASSPCELDTPKENGDTDQVFEYEQPASLKEVEEKDRDCDTTQDGVSECEPEDGGDLRMEQEAPRAPNPEALEESQQPSGPGPAQQIEGHVETEEQEMPLEELQGGHGMA